MVLTSCTSVLVWCLHGHRVQDSFKNSYGLLKYFLFYFFEEIILSMYFAYVAFTAHKVKDSHHHQVFNCCFGNSISYLHTKCHLQYHDHQTESRTETSSSLHFGVLHFIKNLTEQILHICCNTSLHYHTLSALVLPVPHKFASFKVLIGLIGN